MLTENQRRVLKHVLDTISSEGLAPTVGETAKAVGLSHGGAHKILSALADRGYIKRRPGKARAISIISSPAEEKAAA